MTSSETLRLEGYRAAIYSPQRRLPNWSVCVLVVLLYSFPTGGWISQQCLCFIRRQFRPFWTLWLSRFGQSHHLCIKISFEVLFVCQACARVAFVFILCKIMPPSVFTVCEYLKYIWQSQILDYLLFLQFCMNLKMIDI